MNNQQAPLPPSQSKPPKTLFLLILHTCHILSISMILIFDPPPDDPSSPPPLRRSTRPKKKSIKAGFDYSLLLLAALHAGTLGTLTPYAANYRFPSAYHGNAKITRYSLDRKKFLGATWAPVQISLLASLDPSTFLYDANVARYNAFINPDLSSQASLRDIADIQPHALAAKASGTPEDNPTYMMKPCQVNTKLTTTMLPSMN